MKTDTTQEQDKTQQPPKAEEKPATPAFTKFIEKGLAIPKKEKKATPAPPADDADRAPGDGAPAVDQPDGQQPPAKRKPAAPARPAPPAIDEERLGKSIAEGLAPHLAQRQEKEEKPKADENLSEAEQRQIAVLLHMEQMDEYKGKYKGVSDRFKSAMKEKRDYIAQWKKDHPGEEFDNEADEHQGFLDGIDDKIGYDPDDFDEARVDLRASKKVASTKKEIDERVAKIEKNEQLRARSTEIARAGEMASEEFWREVTKGDETLAGLVDKDGKVDSKAIAALKDKDEQAYNIVSGLAEASKTYGSLIHMLDSGLVEYDGKNEAHLFVSNFAFEQEQKYLKAKAPDAEGREFVAQADYLKMSPAQRARHWTFTGDDLKFLLTRHCAKIAKEDLQREEQKFRSRAKQRGLLKDDDADAAGNATQRNGQRQNAGRLNDPADDDEEKPNVPSTMTAPKTARGNAALNEANLKPVDRFLGRYLK